MGQGPLHGTEANHTASRSHLSRWAAAVPVPAPRVRRAGRSPVRLAALCVLVSFAVGVLAAVVRLNIQGVL